MADKKLTATEKKAESKATERKRLIGAGAVLAAVALFVGGYAVGNAADDDGRFVVVADDDRFGRDAPFTDRYDRYDNRFERDDRWFPGRDYDFEFPEDFDFPRDFDFPERFDFPEGFEFPGPRGRFDCPEGFEFPEDFDFPGDGHFEFDFHFNFPEDFEFPMPKAPLFDEDSQPAEPPPAIDDFQGQGFLGVTVVETPEGVEVAEVFPDSPADGAGVQAGDLIVSVDGVTVSSVPDLIDVIAAAGAGTEVEMAIERDGAELGIDVVLGIRPN